MNVRAFLSALSTLAAFSLLVGSYVATWHHRPVVAGILFFAALPLYRVGLPPVRVDEVPAQ